MEALDTISLRKTETKAINQTLERNPFQQGNRSSDVIFQTCHKDNVSISALWPVQCPAGPCSF